MIAVDTNVLVHAHRADSPLHAPCAAALSGLLSSGRPWGLPWPCVHELLGVLTHPRIWDPPTPLPLGLQALEVLVSHPRVVLLGETPDHLRVLAGLVERGRVAGPKVHDARVAALCLTHDVDELWTVDRDFAAFPELRTRNPVASPLTS